METDISDHPGETEEKVISLLCFTYLSGKRPKDVAGEQELLMKDAIISGVVLTITYRSVFSPFTLEV
jgi:hypothetical protein